MMNTLTLYPNKNLEMINASIYADNVDSIDIVDCGYNSKGELVTYVCVLNFNDGTSSLCDTHRDEEFDDLWDEIIHFWTPKLTETK
tara:strand:+ start:545 stop:802 length:258 start_codon:yes stop_codon:yes gene_type:complete